MTLVSGMQEVTCGLMLVSNAFFKSNHISKRILMASSPITFTVYFSEEIRLNFIIIVIHPPLAKEERKGESFHLLRLVIPS